MTWVTYYFTTKRFYRDTSGAKRPKDVVAACLIPVNALEFLDIPYNEAEQKELKTRTVKEHQRTAKRANGSGEEQTITVKSYEVPVVARKPQGGKSVRLKTGKVTPTTAQRPNKVFHTISLNFPSWMKVLAISDFLGEIIPEGKLSFEPGANEVFPKFTLPSGNSHPIMSKATATGTTPAEGGVSTDKAQIDAVGG